MRARSRASTALTSPPTPSTRTFDAVRASITVGGSAHRSSPRSGRSRRDEPMKIGIPKEIHVGERRVAATPETVEQLAKLGHRVAIERGAGANAAFTDDAYRQAGAEIVPNARALWSGSDIVLKVRAPEPDVRLGVHETELLREGGMLIC